MWLRLTSDPEYDLAKLSEWIAQSPRRLTQVMVLCVVSVGGELLMCCSVGVGGEAMLCEDGVRRLPEGASAGN